MLNNCCQFIGNLGKDPEIRAIQNGANKGGSFTTFSIAVNKQGERDDKPLWVNVTTFGKTSDFAAKYLKQGAKVIVRGSLELQEYEGKDGKNHTSLKLIANELLSLNKSEGTNGTAPAAAAKSTATAITDEDIPF
jgi:single-strand DNA-binding protein